jgi:hypothetical protein
MGLFCDSLIDRHLTIEQTRQPIPTTQFPITTNPMRLLDTEQECRRLPSEKRDPSMGDRSRFHTLKKACSIERLAPERRGPHPAAEEGKLELTEALRSNDRS